MRKPIASVSGSLGSTLLMGGAHMLLALAASAATQVDPHLEPRILNNLFVPFEVLVAAEQGKSIHHYLKNHS